MDLFPKEGARIRGPLSRNWDLRAEYSDKTQPLCDDNGLILSLLSLYLSLSVCVCVRVCFHRTTT